MKDSEYLKQMVALGEELERVASSEPYDPDAYNKVIEAINRTNRVWYHGRRQRSWISHFVVISVILFIAYLVYLLLSEL